MNDLLLGYLGAKRSQKGQLWDGFEKDMIHPAGSDSLLLGFPLNENGYVNTRLVFLSEGLETHEFQLLHVF